MKKILIVDDEEEILSILEKKLKANNYQCLTTSIGSAVINICRSDKPDLILLDIAMPDMDGYAVAYNIREDELLKDIPIIFLTGKELEPKSIARRVEQLGAYCFITKPCSFPDLLAKIKEVLG